MKEKERSSKFTAPEPFADKISINTNSKSAENMMKSDRSQFRQVLEKALKRHSERLLTKIQHLENMSRRFGQIRLFLFFGGAFITFLAFHFFGDIPSWSILFLLLAVFLFLSRLHKKVDDSIRRYEIWREIKLNQLARMELDWQHIPATSSFAVLPDHPYETDLLIDGNRSLHHLIDSAASLGGSERLRQWLLKTDPDPSEMLSRQKLIGELKPLTGFRDKLQLHSRLVQRKEKGQWEVESLLNWLEFNTSGKSLKSLLTILTSLSALSILTGILYALGLLPPVWIFPYLAYVAIYFIRIQEHKDTFDEASHLQDSLSSFQSVFRHLETYPYPETGGLREQCRPFLDPRNRPSKELKKVTWLAGAAAISQRNEILRLLLNGVVPWDIFFAYRLNLYKEKLHGHLTAWMERFYEIEALCSLSQFAYLNPDYTYPELLQPEDPANSPLFEAVDLGHPLIPRARKVCNDFMFQKYCETGIITGSNMSGKSTFLRTVGINLSLAYAGAPVNASRLRIVPLKIFTCINVSDSLNDSISYFYAEVRRLKALLAEVERENTYPVLFLIDEIFKGTNNRERLIGSRAYIRRVSQTRSLGLIATHDLELVALADEIANIRNYHFREEVIDSRMKFDYKLHPGPCPTTNALKIMEMEGLPVDDELDTTQA